MSTTSVFLFRHGETDWNVAKKFQGTTDIPLNAKGFQQAEGLAEKIAKLNLEVVVSSDLIRAQKTAEIATQGLSIPIIMSPLLREAQFGQAEGMKFEEVQNHFGQDLWSRWIDPDPANLDLRFPGGESKREQLTRIRQFLSEFIHNHSSYRRIGVSTHGGVLRRFIYSADEGAPTERIEVPNVGLYQMEFSTKNSHWRFVGPVATP